MADSANAVTWENVSSKPASYTPASHASSATTYGVGTASNYGHVKLGATEQNGATATDGIVAPNGHTHSQYALSSTLAAVATSGSYNDLFNKPTITDTKNTVGSTNSTSKLFLVGATSQDTAPQSYSNTNVYAINGSLYATNFYENGNPLAGKYLGLHGTADMATTAKVATKAYNAVASQILYTNSYAIGGPVLGLGATLDDDDRLLLGTLPDLLNENLNTYTIDVDTLGEQSIELRANYALLRTYGQGGLHVSEGENSQSQIVAQSFLSANTSGYFAAMIGTTSNAGFVVGTGKDLNAQTVASLSGTSVTKYGIDSIIHKNITLTLPSTAGKIPSISYSNGVMTVNV